MVYLSGAGLPGCPGKKAVKDVVVVVVVVSLIMAALYDSDSSCECHDGSHGSHDAVVAIMVATMLW